MWYIAAEICAIRTSSSEGKLPRINKTEEGYSHSLELLQQREFELEAVRAQRKGIKADVAGELEKFRILSDITLAMTAERCLEENLALFATKSRELLSGDASFIALRDNEAGALLIRSSSGIRTEAFRDMCIPFGSGFDRKVADMETGYIVEDYSREIEPIVPGLVDIVRKEGLVSGVVAPLRMNKANVGVLHVFNRAHTNFSKSHLHALCLLGNLASLAITQNKAETESEEKYRLVVENANDAILVVQDEVLKFMNPKAKEIFGFAGDASTVSLFCCIHPEDREMVLHRYHKRLSGQPAPSRYSFRIIDGNRKVRWVEVSAVLITWEGNPGTLNFVSDITERRKVEEDLLKVEKLQSVSLLAGGIAHDFNNILAAILGNISLAKVYIEPKGKAFERLTQAEKACLRAQRLTQQLLTFSKGGAPVKEVTNIAKLVRECCQFALRGSNIRCVFDCSDDLWPVEVDQGQISQVIDNLVINAVHAMADGGLIKVQATNVVVSLEDGLQLERGRYVRISLKDHGVGISEEHMPKIFDPYFTTKKTGSGLGLATSYAVIKRHGGIITVESQSGEGATFHVYLPASEKEIVDEPDSDKEPALGGGKILLMDDEEVIRDLGRELLTMLGYEVVVAKDGQEAVDLFREAHNSSRPFDAVIVDLTVPGGMGGSEVIKILREFAPNMKAIVSSGYSNDPVMAHYERNGFDGVVAKPYTVTELSETLKKILEPKTVHCRES
jgi:PAS domain S-box-containing protein